MDVLSRRMGTSGGAALVGAGIADIAIGADQVRIPAALCGCVGFKPTHGLVPYTELMSGDAVIDHAGPITQTVLNIALAMDAISGYDGIDDLQPEVRTQVFSAAMRFKQLGASVNIVSIPQHLEGPATWMIQQRLVGMARLPWTNESFSQLFLSTQNVILNGLYLEATFPGLYGSTMNEARRLRDTYETYLADLDALITPTTPCVAPHHGS
ncbi:hypothetical protein ACKAV7_005606 [Fusarium commune]